MNKHQMRRVSFVLWSSKAVSGEVAAATPRAPSVYNSNGSGDLYWPKSAQEYIAAVPVQKVHDNQVRCDGGGGALGHPAIFVNLNRGVGTCGYCGLRFEQEHDHHAHH